MASFIASQRIEHQLRRGDPSSVVEWIRICFGSCVAPRRRSQPVRARSWATTALHSHNGRAKSFQHITGSPGACSPRCTCRDLDA